MPPPGQQGQHLATLPYEGRFWDVYLELEQREREPARGRLIFAAADLDNADPIRTGMIFVEDSTEEVTARARAMNPHQLLSLLRSCLP
ncbi:MAG: hypothetical protein HY561_03165 [Gemmatimonadetes bacterium]|nr:hypothetical protein [Gemmatimonadota bacterium]